MLAQRERITLLNPHAQFLLLFFRQDSRGQHPLQWRLSLIIHATYPILLGKDQCGKNGNQALCTGILDGTPGQEEGLLHG